MYKGINASPHESKIADSSNDFELTSQVSATFFCWGYVKIQHSEWINESMTRVGIKYLFELDDPSGKLDI